MILEYKLKDLCSMEITDGTHQTPIYSQEGYIFLSSKNVTSGVIDWDHIMYIPEELHNELYKRVQPQMDDILLAKNGTTGIAAIVDKQEIFDIYVSLALIRPDQNKILPRYLLHAINSPRSKKYFDNSLKGIGVPNLHLTHIRETPIIVPSLDEQKEIVGKIDRVDALISLRKKQLQKLDDLVKARFIEMTQSSVTTSVRMGDVATYVNGFAFKPIEWTTEGLPIIRIQNLNDTEAPYNHYAGAIDSKYRVHTGDILVSWATHLEAYIWQGGDAWLNQHIFRVIFDKMPINQIYYVYSTEEALHQAFRNAHGFKPTMEHIKRSDFEDAIIALPPIEIQEKFAAFVSQVDKSKLFIQQGLEKLETLKKSLMQQYFG